MDAVNFLNFEYLLLYLERIISGINTFLSGNYTGEGSGAHIVTQFGFLFGQIALLGMAVSVILLALAVWVRIRLEIIEHEGFHGAHDEEHHETAHDTSLPSPTSPVDARRERWARIESLASSQNESEWRRAIVEADIMLGELLIEQGYRGKTLGEQLKDANPLQFTTLNSAWAAHKVRNSIAHEGDNFHLSERDARGAIDNFKRVFEEFSFI